MWNTVLDKNQNVELIYKKNENVEHKNLSSDTS
jgi:hypothetical protein